MYRVVEGLLPAIPTEDFLKPIETRRHPMRPELVLSNQLVGAKQLGRK